MDAKTLSPAFEGELVALSGKAGSGKSVVAEVASSLGYERVRFAAPLKAMLGTLYEFAGLDQDDIERRIEGDLKEKPDGFLEGATPRHAMQTLGGEWGRELIHPDLWIELWKRRVSPMLMAGRNVIVEDLRYANEEDAVRDLGGIVMEIRRDDHKHVPSHPSEEHECDPWMVIHNMSTKEDLEDCVRPVLKAFLAAGN